MSKISEEQRKIVDDYIRRNDLKYLYEYAQACNTVEEVDAVISCLHEIDQERRNYHCAFSLAPRNPKRTITDFQNTVEKFGYNEEQALRFYEEEKDFYFSQIKSVKNGVVKQMRSILTEAGIGKKRIEKLIPRLMYSLQDSDLIEDIGEPVPEHEMKDFLSKINQK